MVALRKMDNSCNMEVIEEQVECRAVEPDQKKHLQFNCYTEFQEIVLPLALKTPQQ